MSPEADKPKYGVRVPEHLRPLFDKTPPPVVPEAAPAAPPSRGVAVLGNLLVLLFLAGIAGFILLLVWPLSLLLGTEFWPTAGVVVIAGILVRLAVKL